MGTDLYKIKEITSLIRRGISPSYTDRGGILVLNQKCVRNQAINWNLARRNDVSLRQVDEQRILAPYDVVVNSTGVGTLGRVAQVVELPEKATVDSHVTILRPNPKLVNPLFFGLLMRSKQRLIEQLGEGSTGQTELSRGKLAEIEVSLPPLAEQRRIANILGTLDDKIELNRRMNATLEAIARALFKSWFVDFDPVRAKAAGRPSGLPPALDALFPDRFVESELGEIPEGWEVKAIGDVVEVVGGGTPSTKNPEFWEGGTYAFATPKDLSSITSPILLETEKKVTEAGVERISSGLLPKGTLLISSRAPVGYLAISAIPVCVNQGFIAMKCNEIPNFFVLNWAQENMNSIQAVASGTTFPEVSKANFRPLQVLLPSPSLIAAHANHVKAFYILIEHNLKRSQILSEVRDRLLPRLMQVASNVLLR